MVFGNEKWLESRIAELERGAEIIQTTRGPVELKRQDSPLRPTKSQRTYKL